MVDDAESPRAGQHAPGRPGVVPPHDGDGEHGHLERAGESEGAGTESLEASVRCASPFGKDHHRLAGLEQSHRLPRRAGVGGVDLDGKSAQATDNPREPGYLKQSVPGHKVYGEAYGDTDEDGIGVGHVIRYDDERPVRGNVLRPLEADPPVEARPEVDEGTENIQDGRAHALSVPRRL